MHKDELVKLHKQATEARDLAHKAYEIALSVRYARQAPGDTDAAYQTLLSANKVRDAIYAQLLKLVAA